MKLTELIKQGTGTISRLYPEREAREMVLAYLCHTLGITRHTHLTEPSYEVPDESLDTISSDMKRMASGEPLQYVTGQAHFYGREFRVTPAVLIPRPETELLCRMALDTLPDDAKVLDLCTGSGCVAWTMALERPDAEVIAVDISEDALEIAAGQKFAAEMRQTGALAPHFIGADVLSDSLPEDLPARRFDLILSNPPYVMDKEKALMRSNVLDHEPHLALFVPDDDPLIFYRSIARHAASLLKDSGICIVEINEALGPETAAVFAEAGFADTRISFDLADRPRYVAARRACR